MLGVAFLSVAVLASSSDPVSTVLRSTTARPLQDFGTCFAAIQERDLRPWSFIPDGRGGSFTDLGDADGTCTYRLTLTERPQGLDIRLAARGDEATGVAVAVQRCR